MNFVIGDMPFYSEYTFTDTGEKRPHFGLILLPEKSTRYQSSNLCCVITSQSPNSWCYELKKENYVFFKKDSFACLDRKDLVSQNCLSENEQPKGTLQISDLKEVYKILKKSLFVIKDIASDPFIRATIIKEWKERISLLDIQ